MASAITPAVEEVISLAESGALFRDPQPMQLGDVLVTHSTDDLQRWLYTEARPGIVPEDDEGYDWLNLRERMASKILHTDAKAAGLDSKALRALEDLIAPRVDHALYDRLPASLREYREDIGADLLHCALSRALRSSGDHAALFERIFEGYKAGVFPCGWEGSYPAGRMAVFVPSDPATSDR